MLPLFLPRRADRDQIGDGPLWCQEVASPQNLLEVEAQEEVIRRRQAPRYLLKISTGVEFLTISDLGSVAFSLQMNPV